MAILSCSVNLLSAWTLQNSFFSRVIDHWNSLPNNTVSAGIFSSFKARHSTSWQIYHFIPKLNLLHQVLCVSGPHALLKYFLINKFYSIMVNLHYMDFSYRKTTSRTTNHTAFSELLGRGNGLLYDFLRSKSELYRICACTDVAAATDLLYEPHRQIKHTAMTPRERIAVQKSYNLLTTISPRRVRQ